MTKADIINYSSFAPPFLSKIPVLKKRNYWVVKEVSTMGDRPKDFIRVYEFGSSNCRRANRKTWVPYIAKVGDKWYPGESLTEYLLNKLGEIVGVRMAASKLYILNGQIRFCSRYFLDPFEELLHGAQIYATFLQDDDFIEEIEKYKKERDFITFQLTEDAIKALFGIHAETILKDFTKMLVFDALVGNNDRHFYNWGIIRDTRGKKPPRFSPVFDTARGLFWNERETALSSFEESAKFDKYVNKAFPKVSWEGKQALNHLELIRTLMNGRS